MTNIHPDIIKLANYMGFFIECKYQAAMGNREFRWMGYGGVVFARVECIDLYGKSVVPMGFEEYKEWNDSVFWRDPGKSFTELHTIKTY